MATRTKKLAARIACTCPSCDRYNAPAGKFIAYCHETHDLGAYYDGILIGYFRTHLAAETALDEHVYELRASGALPTEAELADDREIVMRGEGPKTGYDDEAGADVRAGDIAGLLALADYYGAL